MSPTNEPFDRLSALSPACGIEELRALIRDVRDFPKPGIVFKDITPLLLKPGALQRAAGMILEGFRDRKIEIVAGIESRGFTIGAAVALQLNVGLALVRKKGKLPYTTISETYALEYGTDAVEMHIDAVKPGQNVLVIDDLIATGGTASAACKLVEQLEGKVVGCGFIIELSFLKGRDKLSRYRTLSLIEYDKE